MEKAGQKAFMDAGYRQYETSNYAKRGMESVSYTHLGISHILAISGLHISEMSWGRVENPKKVFTVGQTVRVFVKNIYGSKIALSMKFDDENPWNGATEKFAPVSYTHLDVYKRQE